MKIRFISRRCARARTGCYKTVVAKNSTIPRDENIYEDIFLEIYMHVYERSGCDGTRFLNDICRAVRLDIPRLR